MPECNDSMSGSIMYLTAPLEAGGCMFLIQAEPFGDVAVRMYGPDLRRVELPPGADTIPVEILAQMVRTYVDQKSAETPSGGKRNA